MIEKRTECAEVFFGDLLTALMIEEENNGDLAPALRECLTTLFEQSASASLRTRWEALLAAPHPVPFEADPVAVSAAAYLSETTHSTVCVTDCTPGAGVLQFENKRQSGKKRRKKQKTAGGNRAVPEAALSVKYIEFPGSLSGLSVFRPQLRPEPGEEEVFRVLAGSGPKVKWSADGEGRLELSGPRRWFAAFNPKTFKQGVCAVLCRPGESGIEREELGKIRLNRGPNDLLTAEMTPELMMEVAAATFTGAYMLLDAAPRRTEENKALFRAAFKLPKLGQTSPVFVNGSAGSVMGDKRPITRISPELYSRLSERYWWIGQPAPTWADRMMKASAAV